MTNPPAAAAAAAAAAPSTPQVHPLLSGITRTLGPTLTHHIASSRILLIGAGGIGCELLKNLSLSGFTDVTVVDLDTIDVSNLNRQFLFRSRHVGMAKCTVGAEVAAAMAPPPPAAAAADGSADEDAIGRVVEYTSIHGNVCDATKFNVSYLQSFALVLNALDNVTARRRVNRLALAAKVPLIEAGTTGYLGQVTVIDKPSAVECYECQTKPTQKVYPICTIRSTPSMPVHCIVWAKEFWKLCFGEKVEDSMLFEDEDVGKEDEDEGGEGEEKKDKDGEDDEDDDMPSGGPSTYMEDLTTLRALLQSKDSTSQQVSDQATKVLTALYVTEITKQIDMGRYKTANKVPAPLMEDDLAPPASTQPPTAREGYNTTDIWSKPDCTAELISCIVQAHEMYKSNEAVAPTFDKDDELAMRFVTAAANLRQYVFKINPIQSLYSAKGIAGNIIPAIATTNAIVAGLQVLQAFHILRVQLEAKESGDAGQKEAEGRYRECCRYQYCLRGPTRKGYLIQPSSLPPPNTKCFVCRSATVDVTLDTSSWTMDMLLKKIVKGELGFAEPTILINGDLVYEEGDGAEEDYVCNLPKTLDKLPAGGIQGGTVVRVEDFTQDLEVDLSFAHREVWSDEEWKDKDPNQRYVIGGDRPVAAAPAPAAATAAPDASDNAGEEKKDDDEKADEEKAAAAAAEDDDDDNDIIVVDEHTTPLKNGFISKKRKATSDEDGTEAKKAKVPDADSDIEIVEIE